MTTEETIAYLEHELKRELRMKQEFERQRKQLFRFNKIPIDQVIYFETGVICSLRLAIWLLKQG